MNRIRSWFLVGISFFIIAGLLGATLRLAFVIEMPEWFHYRNIAHAHSHIAMMGWIYCGLFAFIIHYFNLSRKIYKHLFWGAAICAFGMLISFPIQGYGLFSIFFTSLHLILSYIFVLFAFKELGNIKDKENLYSRLFLKTGMLFMVFSTLGTWMLGIIMGTGLKGSALYYGSIQFFLHFQFNGWFIFTAIAITLCILRKLNINIDDRYQRKFYWLLTVSCILTYALSITWSTPDKFIFWINSTGVLIQFIALIYFVRIAVAVSSKLKVSINKWSYYLLRIAFICVASKILIQTFVAIPYFATISYTIKNFVIGFIHLLMLGGMSVFLFAVYNENQPINNKLFPIGISTFLTCFVFSEVLLFLQGLLLWMKLGFLPYYYIIIFLITLIMALGVLITGISCAKQRIIVQ